MRLDVKGYHHAYPVHIEEGLITTLDKVMDFKKPAVLITDDGIPGKWVDLTVSQLKPRLTIKVPKGEASKSFDAYRDILLQMQKNHVERSDRVVALGGGMVSDLAGFVAATYKRGLAFTIIPTTLLSMVDASVGGKVAINTPFAKNSVGTFHTPDQVIIDPTVLRTLPKRHFNNGMAEVIKTALIGDKALFDYLVKTDDGMDLNYIIKASVQVKKTIVEEDPLDQGKRGLLNYGHTIGHAIESLSEYRHLHGECVAMGMRMMAKGKPYEKTLHSLLDKYELNRVPQFDVDRLSERIREDKKVTGETLAIPCVEKVGNGFMTRFSFNDFNAILRKGMLE
ncbi:MAG: 3-dehydroquinate synthase [Candidatus Izemoplasmataceae bacterium]